MEPALTEERHDEHDDHDAALCLVDAWMGSLSAADWYGLLDLYAPGGTVTFLGKERHGWTQLRRSALRQADRLRGARFEQVGRIHVDGDHVRFQTTVVTPMGRSRLAHTWRLAGRLGEGRIVHHQVDVLHHDAVPEAHAEHAPADVAVPFF